MTSSLIISFFREFVNKKKGRQEFTEDFPFSLVFLGEVCYNEDTNQRKKSKP